MLVGFVGMVLWTSMEVKMAEGEERMVADDCENDGMNK